MCQQSAISFTKVTEVNLIQELMPINFPLDQFERFEQFESMSHPIADTPMAMRYCFEYGPVSEKRVNKVVSCQNQMLAMKNLFSQQYLMLIFFCMIQFRNYQAATLNILQLVIANFIS